MTTTIYHYVYRITNIIENKHYYGARKSIDKTPHKDLGIRYISSSYDNDFINEQKEHPERFKYKVIREFSTREEAIRLEIILHTKYDVANNSNFYNNANQTSTSFDTSGTATVRDIDGNVFNVSVNDSRYLSGELVHNNTGRKNNCGADNGRNKGTFIFDDIHYTTIKELADTIGCSSACVYRYCYSENDRLITMAAYCRSSFLQGLGDGVIGKTFKEIGFGFNIK